MTQLHDLTAVEQATALAVREISSAELTEHYLDRIDRLAGPLGAFVTKTPELARP
jgi:amidase